MSDFNSLKSKVKEGRAWRGSIRVTMDDEEHELAVRQLVDPELEEVMDLINREELKELQEQLPEDVMSEIRELQDADELGEEDESRLAELQAEVEDEGASLFDALSTETMSGIRRAGMYAVVPDDDDLEDAFRNRASAIEHEYGIKVKKPEDCYDALNEEIQDMIRNSVKMVGFNIGLQALLAAVEEAGN